MPSSLAGRGVVVDRLRECLRGSGKTQLKPVRNLCAGFSQADIILSLPWLRQFDEQTCWSDKSGATTADGDGVQTKHEVEHRRWDTPLSRVPRVSLGHI